MPSANPATPQIERDLAVLTSLTGLAGEIADAIGAGPTFALLAARGGTEVNVPMHAAGSDLAELIGEDAASAMMIAFGPGRMELPCAHLRGQKGRQARAMRMLMDEASVRDVAMACELHRRTVGNYRATLRDRNLLPAGAGATAKDPSQCS